MAFDLETAIATWRHQYKYNAAFKGRDLDELERHVRDHVEWLADQGLDHEQAFRQAVAELGNQVETESDFRSVAFMKTRDRGEVGTEVRIRLAMMASYMRVAVRNLRRNRTGSIVNVVSLSVAVAVAIVSFLFISNVLTRNNFHEHSKNLYLVHQVTDDGQWWGHSPMPLGPALAESVPEIVHMSRVVQSRTNIDINGNQFGVNVAFVDDDFLASFTFPLANGSFPGSSSPTDVVLSSDTAERLFGTRDDVVGSTLLVRVGEHDTREVRVSGVAEPFPDNISFRFWMLMAMDARSVISEPAADGWDSFADATFIQIDPAADPDVVTERMNDYIAATNAPSEDWQVAAFLLDNLLNLTMNRDNVRRSVIGSIPWAPVVVLGTLAALLLLLASVNFMNITLSTSIRRLKEIGVRKVIGAQRRQIMTQFLVENLELSVASVLAGGFLAWVFVLPAFNGIANLNLSLDLLSDWRLWSFLILLVVTLGVVSGAYPAWYITSFRPTSIFRGRLDLNRRRFFSHGLQAFQFVVTALALFAGTTLYLNARYHAERPLGYEAANLVNFHADSSAEMDVLLAHTAQLADVESWTTTGDVVGLSSNYHTVVFEGTELEFMLFDASNSYARQLGVPLVSGQFPDDGVGSDGIVVNESFVRKAGMESAVGQPLLVDGVTYTISGVVSDFHFTDFFSVIWPAAFRVTLPEAHSYVSVRTLSGEAESVVSSMREAFAAAFPQKELSVMHQDEVMQEFREESGGITRIFLFVALLSLVISGLSIYALSTQNVANRQKEIGIRKVLGARPIGIVQVVNRRIAITLFISLLLAAPVGYPVLNILLDNLYAYRMEIGAVPFIAAALIVGVVTVLTLLIQIRSIRSAQPATILRSE